jgi:hypothetical protein
MAMSRREALAAFKGLMERTGVQEREFQALFAECPYVLSESLPVAVEESEIVARGRPGQSEADFIILPEPHRTNLLYGAIELKRPDQPILAARRKGVLMLSSVAQTGLSQARAYAREVGRQLIPSIQSAVSIGSGEYAFVIVGRRSELERTLLQYRADDLREFLHPNCHILPYDALYDQLHKSVPPVTFILKVTAPSAGENLLSAREPGPTLTHVVPQSDDRAPRQRGNLYERSHEVQSMLGDLLRIREWLYDHWFDRDSTEATEGIREDINACYRLGALNGTGEDYASAASELDRIYHKWAEHLEAEDRFADSVFNS